MRLHELESRLVEISKPSPTLAQVAVEVAGKVYERLWKRLRGCIASVPGARVGEYRVVFPVDERHTRAEETSVARPHPEVARTLERYGFEIADWIEGTARRRSDGRVFAIGRLLGRLANPRDLPHLVRGIDSVPEPLDPEEVNRLTRLFANDPARRGVASARRRGKWVAVLTFDPVENAHMSTRRGWVSCRTVRWAEKERREEDEAPWEPSEPPGMLPSELECALKRGEAVLWLTDEEDAWTLDRPVGRSAVAVETGPRGAIRLQPTEAYGSLPPWWHRVAAEITDAVNRACGAVPGVYHVPPPEKGEAVEYVLRGVGADDVLRAVAGRDEDALEAWGLPPDGEAFHEVLDLMPYAHPREITEVVRDRATAQKLVRALFDLGHPRLAHIYALIAAAAGGLDPERVARLPWRDVWPAYALAALQRVKESGARLDGRGLNRVLDLLVARFPDLAVHAEELGWEAEEGRIDYVREFLRRHYTPLIERLAEKKGEKGLLRLLRETPADERTAPVVLAQVARLYEQGKVEGRREPSHEVSDAAYALVRRLPIGARDRLDLDRARSLMPPAVRDALKRIGETMRDDPDAALALWMEAGRPPLWLAPRYADAALTEHVVAGRIPRFLRVAACRFVREIASWLRYGTERDMAKIRPDCYGEGERAPERRG